MDGVLESRLKVFVDDELLYVTDLRLEDKVFSEIRMVTLNALIATVGVIYVDNLSFVQSIAEYDGLPVTHTIVE